MAALNAQVQGGSLKHDGTCDQERTGRLATAAWDAHTLAGYARGWPHGARGVSAGRYYIGPDYETQQQRIQDNLGRAADFMTKGSDEIFLSCKDTKNYCNVQKDGKSVGAYAWTVHGWFWDEHHITLCPPFFDLDSLDQKIDELEKDLAAGNTKSSSDARYQKTMGQFFLHEMMHLDLIGKPPTPAPPIPAKPPYEVGPGKCRIHANEIQICGSATEDLSVEATVFDGAGNQIGYVRQTKAGATNPLSINSKLEDGLVIIPEHQGDYIQFYLGTQHWRSTDTDKDAAVYCNLGGWDPAQGLACGLDNLFDPGAQAASKSGATVDILPHPRTSI
ncbi:MAG: hypothetical protein M1826_004531 [Phylliscum demangeonii]|nr:MAG: hypothetical protein M1826_004531 [Phylliscum demangeonii]